jgi:hypothetical protein
MSVPPVKLRPFVETTAPELKNVSEPKDPEEAPPVRMSGPAIKPSPLRKVNEPDPLRSDEPDSITMEPESRVSDGGVANEALPPGPLRLLPDNMLSSPPSASPLSATLSPANSLKEPPD